eukprot:gnl/TRDRNA2_/TRDRNA2_161155_c0_seq1.p1 gnl/TRDRNA2_/TRDRNA2_161155_c0~~gnl/TRDRNA2_/TRDRNA2_161155_c0_seq1.p1  ORF type:complete len:769 (-),score=59.27 gnl/TRDRNA2_/TRDRNA2_161155_c0_seq1:52-2316(-)
MALEASGDAAVSTGRLRLVINWPSRARRVASDDDVSNNAADCTTEPESVTDGPSLATVAVAPTAPQQCIARVWNGGRGAQCAMRVVAGHEYCGQHLKQVHLRVRRGHPAEPVHGRIDGPVPVEKAQDFAEAAAAAVEAGRIPASSSTGARDNRELPRALASRQQFSLRSRAGCNAPRVVGVDKTIKRYSLRSAGPVEEPAKSPPQGVSLRSRTRAMGLSEAAEQIANAAGAEATPGSEVVASREVNEVTTKSDDVAPLTATTEVPESSSINEPSSAIAASTSPQPAPLRRLRRLSVTSLIVQQDLPSADVDKSATGFRRLRRTCLPQPLENYDQSSCMARVWGGGQGAQCSRARLQGADFCQQHSREHESGAGIPHGRIDGPVPEEKILDFLLARHNRRDAPQRSASSDASSSSAHDSRRRRRADEDGRSAEHHRSVRRRCRRRLGRQRHSRRLNSAPANARAPRQPPKPMEDFDMSLCLARVWAGGHGAQCSRTPAPGSEFCSQHRRDATSEKGLAHGRIDGFVPADKVADFLNADTSCDDSDFSGDSSGSDAAAALPCESAGEARVSRRTQRKPGDLLCTGRGEAPCCFDIVSEETCVLILEGLEQVEIFRAAMSCWALRQTADLPRLYRRLDLRAVGRTVTTRGRVRMLSNHAVLPYLFEVLKQPRFVRVTELDFTDVYLGKVHPENNQLLAYAAVHCPLVRHLYLGRAEPSEYWSDLARYLPTSFERSMREWWKERPLVIEGYGRRYSLN